MLATGLFRPNACPPAEVLAAYSCGRLPDHLLAPAADHLTACAACLETMRQLEGSDDPLIANLRRFVPEKSPTLTPEALPPPASAFSELANSAEGFVTTAVQGPRAGGAAANPGPPRTFAGYELLEELGRGGMGNVYKARQTALDRMVALKVIAAGSAAGPESQARFRVEAKAVARLRHPQVVQIYDFGEENGQPYFSMELMEGGSLKDRLGGKQQPQRESAELVRTLGLAIHAAHGQQIVHRDLKPANVLLAPDGSPKIGDFGLAKLLDAEQSQTLTDVIMGTPAYMAPEQVSGSNAVGPLVDVYALGVILYEMLTGRPPFRGASRMETLDQVRYLAPPSMFRLRPDIAPDLEAVCSKCLEKDPLGRYPSAEALADDLGRWLRGESTRAKPLSRAARVRRALGRHPVWSAVAGILMVVTLAAGGVAVHRDPDRQRAAIEGEIRKGEKVELLGETGKPRWSRWRAGEAQASAGLDPLGTFYLNSAFNKVDIALLELTPSVQQDRYRFEAEVRHDDTAWGGQVGVYLAHQAVAGKPDGLQTLTILHYNDIEAVMDAYNAIPRDRGIPQPPPPKGNPVRFESRIFAEQTAPRYCSMGVSNVSNELFQPAGRGVGLKPWRKLAIEVTPQLVRVRWEGKLVGEIDPREWCQQVGAKMPGLILSDPHLFAAKPVPPQLDFRGGLGLFVRRSAASFRNITVGPLD